MQKDRTITVTLTVICQSFQALSIGGVSLLLPLIREDLGLTFTQGGSLAAVTTIMYALMQIPAGYLSDRFSPKRLFIVGVLGSTILSLTFGLVSNYQQALLNQSLAGIFRSLLFVPGMALLTGWFPPERRATAIGLNIVGISSGSLLFNLVGPLIVAIANWRAAFISVASFGIFCSLLLLRFGKESPSQKPRVTIDILEIFRLFRSNVMWICGIIQFIRMATMLGTVYWLPSLLYNERGISIRMTGFLMAIQGVLIASSNVLGGYISDRLKSPVVVISSSMIVLGFTSILLVNVQNLVLTVIIIIINAIFLQMYFGPIFAIPIEFYGTRKAGILTGFSNFFANAGGFAATFLLGVIKDSYGGFNYGFYTIAGICFTGLLFNFILSRMRLEKMSLNNIEITNSNSRN